MSPDLPPALPVQHVVVDGRRIAYQERGAGRPVVLVHGNFASKRWFRELLQAPPEGARLLALDLPNFGDSDPLGAPISIAAYAAAVRGFVAALDLTPPVLVGHSLGGAVAMTAVAGVPDAYAALVLVDSSAPTGLVTPEAHYPVLEAFKGQPGLLAQALQPMLASRTPDDFDGLVDDALRMHPDAFKGNARALHDLGLGDHLAAFHGHVLVIRGSLDRLITADMAEATASAFTGAAALTFETWEGVGHSPATEAPDRFAARLEHLLDALPPASGTP